MTEPDSKPLEEPAPTHNFKTNAHSNRRQDVKSNLYKRREDTAEDINSQLSIDEWGEINKYG